MIQFLDLKSAKCSNVYINRFIMENIFILSWLTQYTLQINHMQNKSSESIALVYPELNVKAQTKTSDCVYNCSCQKCLSQGYSTMVVVQNEQLLLFKGPLMIKKPVSNHHQMLGQSTLTFNRLHLFPMKQITKLKCSYVDVIPGLVHIYIVLNTKETRQELNINFTDLNEWYINTVIARLYTTNKLGIPFRKFEGRMIGPVYKSSMFKGWSLTNIEITDRLRMEGGKEVRVINELWTRFDLISMQGLCLIIKFWDGLTKHQIALPLKNVSEWLSAFLSLVKD